MSGVTDAAGGTRIAVVGSGLAGLATAWLLGRSHEVTVFEAADGPGMGAHSVRIGRVGREALVDVPLRVFTPGYYPTLLALFRAAGIEVGPVDYAASFSRLGGDTYFRYRNLRLAGRSLPYLPAAMAMRSRARRIGADLLRLHRRAPRDLARGGVGGRTLGAYLEDEGYSRAFIDDFVLPAYAAICTCATESVRRYPADVIVDYMCSGVATWGVMRALHGTTEVAERLLAPVERTRFATPVDRVRVDAGGVTVTEAGGAHHRFDQVVLATRADQAARLVETDTPLARALARVPHERSRVVVHRDPALAPALRREWSPVNFVVATDRPAPMATIWLNRVVDGLDDEPIFQTWNPLVEPEPGTIVAEATFSRPLVTLDSQEVPATLRVWNADPHRRIRVVGSYAEPGVPLLEAAASSAVRVARTLGVAAPVPPVGRPGRTGRSGSVVVVGGAAPELAIEEEEGGGVVAGSRQ